MLASTLVSPRSSPRFVLLSALAGAILTQSPSALAQTTQTETTDPVERLLDTPPLDRNLWGVVLTDPAGTILFRRNAQRLFMPASNAKIIVSSAAAALLDPTFTVATSVYSAMPIRDGVLQGDLILYGRGDPTMSRRCYDIDKSRAGVCDDDPLDRFRTLARQMTQRGIRVVAGDLIADGSYFEPTVVHPTWETADLTWWYAAPVSGLGFNDNAIDVRANPGATVGEPGTLTLYPDLQEIVVENRTRSVPSDSARTFDLRWDPDSPWHLVATGDIPLGRQIPTAYVAVPDPNRFAGLAFATALTEAGIKLSGVIRTTDDSLATRDARLLAPIATVESRPLADWIFPILNTSQNWFAEMLVKQLGKQRASEGSWDAGLRVERRWLIDEVGVDSTQFALRDGSGLSALSLITPRALAQTLGYIRQHPRWTVFARGLPRSGSPGSLRDRFGGTALAGRVVGKTGSISRVNTLSGFIERPGQSPLIFSVMANHHLQSGPAMIAHIDRVVAALARR